MQRTWKLETVPQTVSIRHTFIHQKLCYQKLHGAMGGGASASRWIRQWMHIMFGDLDWPQTLRAVCYSDSWVSCYNWPCRPARVVQIYVKSPNLDQDLYQHLNRMCFIAGDRFLPSNKLI